MVLVEQLDKDGCAIACMAMVLGCDYYTMRSKIDACIDFLPKWGKPLFELKFKPKEIRKILEKFGTQTTYIKWRPQNSLCILLVTPVKNPEYTHAFVCSNKTICDPMFSDPQPLDHLENFHVHCCIGIDGAF